MKKISLLLVMLLAYCFSATAQSIPVPGDPYDGMLEWIDNEPIQWPDGTYSFSSEFGIYIFNQDVMGNYVANDYPGFEAEFEAMEAGVTLEYTILDREKLSFSIYTDYDQIFTFDPAEYTEFDVPTTIVPMTIFDGPNGDASSTYPHFAWGCVHFASQTNYVDNIPGKEPFFTWRIGVQMHYTDNGETTHSNIVYLEVFPRPVIRGDVNGDGEVDVNDVTLLIDYLLGLNVEIIEANSNMNDDTEIDINDVTALIDFCLGI